MIQPEDSAGVEVELVGDLKAELERLSGAVLRVAGTLNDGGSLVVSRYEILEIAGHIPVVGRLEVRGSDVVLVSETGETLNIQDAEEFEALDGAKVWVILDSKGTVTGYGVIRKR